MTVEESMKDDVVELIVGQEYAVPLPLLQEREMEGEVTKDDKKISCTNVRRNEK
jgi:hypothetical protein